MVAELVFPPRCPWCDAVLGQIPQCPACRETLVAAKRPAGKALRKDGGSLAFVEQAYAPYRYISPVRDAILRMKFRDAPELARPLAKEMVRFLPREQLPLIDCVVPVPSGVKERHKRGYDVPTALARSVAQQLDCAVQCNNLYKQFETPRQMKLTGAQRRVNVLGAFAVKDESAVRGKTILLIDDVITTGSTLNECAKMLLVAGAAQCYALCVADAHERKEGECTPDEESFA
jgi:ComF family protein